MFTCRTCKLLKHSKAKKDIFLYDDGTSQEYRCRANSIMDALSEWYCPYFWWSTKPLKDCGCKNWKNMNGKHWV